MGVFALSHFRQKFLHHHIDHGPRSKSQQIRENRCDKLCCGNGEQSAQRLDDAGSRTGQKARVRLIPAARSGMDMIAPSGKFWIAMPTDKISAALPVISVCPDSQPASTTPTAIPSGILCSVTASISIIFLDKSRCRPSGSSP